MPPLIAVAGLIGGVAVVRWAYRAMLRVNEELEQARRAMTDGMAETVQPAEIPTLRRDPSTGAYRPG
jgi:hypothetical protein